SHLEGCHQRRAPRRRARHALPQGYLRPSARSFAMDALTSTRQKPTIDPRHYFDATAAGARSRTAQRPPLCIYLEVTNRCNLLCTTCPRTYAELEPPTDMSWDLF